MIKNLLIISSDHTGHGHKSITEALCEEFAQYEDLKVHIFDGFSFGGKPLLQVAKSYGPITRNAKDLWKIIWKITLAQPSLINDAIEIIIKENLLEVLEKVKPDMILTVHPNFNGSVLNVLEHNNLKIPFITLLADLVNITPLWADPRADYVICPTFEAKEVCMRLNVEEEKIKVLGFPVRSRFYKDEAGSQEEKEYKSDRPLKCLVMSGGEGSGNMSRIASILLDNFNCTVKIVAGKNIAARRRLESALLGKYGKRVEIYGFINHIQDLMMDSDIAITRGSPNVMMEAVSCNVPLVIVGALPGQEEGNPDYALKNDLGVVCKDEGNLQKVISDLLSDNARKLNLIKKSQRQYSNPDTAKNIVEFILGLEI
ncbi:MGDG synthase family glycosyltransferase [Parasporobacterium paucivorans]|uniref:Processive 1,2-diacylglycerol beta-glucosyltransferase n=1 Tax=Parasporobacterium paucivorans DSM 15970 TaxID=1122934 RepID=A0A1M6D2E5_9FIRM|nr:glycosyltransferase [Parasporobacterium paucivorans]SHI67359.1 processive 1,2-diacylglycerol beta-glucosyltransferase [Parasporobacterium paucivorans DSM 15970]